MPVGGIKIGVLCRQQFFAVFLREPGRILPQGPRKRVYVDQVIHRDGLSECGYLFTALRSEAVAEFPVHRRRHIHISGARFVIIPGEMLAARLLLDRVECLQLVLGFVRLDCGIEVLPEFGEYVATCEGQDCRQDKGI